MGRKHGNIVLRVLASLPFIGRYFRRGPSVNHYPMPALRGVDYNRKRSSKYQKRQDRWLNRPPLCKWQNIPVKAVNTGLKVGRGGMRFVGGEANLHPR